MGPLQQFTLVAVCFLVSVWFLGFLVLRQRRSNYGQFRVKSTVFEVNDSLDQLDMPSGIPKIQILFFHGLPFGKFSQPHLSTWDSGDGIIWPQAWLAEQFPGAHIFFVKYSEGMRVGSFNMNNIGENLISDLLQGNIGQVPGCPVVLVGHCIGGLVIKELCLKAHEQLRSSNASMSDRASKLGAFLDNTRGIFYYSTPHHGIPDIAKAREMLKSPLFKYFEILSSDAAVLNSNFNDLCGLYPKWKIQGIGESLAVTSGVFQNVIVVPEASAREGIFNTMVEDHFSICKPHKKTSGGFYHLTHLLDNVVKEGILLQEESCPQNIQYLPKSIMGIDFPLQEVKARLENVAELGVTGMGGLGKTTLAKAVFNDLCTKFEYTCFVPDVKLINGNVETVKQEVWKYMYRNGKRIVGEGEWSQLRGKRLLLILDDISSDRDVRVLSEIVEGPSTESRYIATSRERDLFDAFYEVPLLDKGNAETVFMGFAFQDKEIPPPMLAPLAEEIVNKCEGLPLTLEVIGQWLKRTKNEEDWRQTLDALSTADRVKNFNERLWAKLRPSIDGLEEAELQMFLDATTFFDQGSSLYMWTLREAQAAWREAYGVNERLLWRALVERSLVYEVKDDESIKVHEQLRSLGRKIARESNQNSKRRVLEIPTAMKLLHTSNDLDKKEIHALRLVRGERSQMPMEGTHELQSVAREGNLEGTSLVDGRVRVSCLALQKLEKLCYLEVDSSIVIHGDEEAKRFPGSLVVFQGAGFSIVNIAHQRRLVVLKIFDHDLKYLPKPIGHLSALRILVVHNAEIETVPDDIRDLKQLEFLHFENCMQLQTLPQTLGQLSKLKNLKLLRCWRLLTLPKSFGHLSALEHLEVGYGYLEALPESFGQLAALKSLKIYACPKIESLPESFGLLSALVKLRLGCSYLKTLPDSFGLLSALVKLKLRGRTLKTLPETFGQLIALSHLEISFCRSLQSLPNSFGNLPVLSHLSLTACHSLHPFPESFGQLAKLQYLAMNGLYELERLPDSCAKLLTLRHLHIWACLSLKSIPDYIRNLPLLDTLELGLLPHVTELPSWLGETGVNPLALSYVAFRIQDYSVSLTEEETEPPLTVLSHVHNRAMRKVETSDFEGALAALEVSSLESLELDGFLLQEKGIIKRMMHDLFGALEYLTAALECFDKADEEHRDTVYDCWKHRGYVKFLMGDQKGAESDGAMARKLEIEWCQKYLKNVSLEDEGYYGVKSLGEESISYMNFTLTGRQDLEEQRELLFSSHSKVMQMVKASDFHEALSNFDAINAALLSDDLRAYFFQERGILKRLARDLDGALEDLTAALEINHDNYDGLKHRGYVKFILDDLDGARLDAEKCSNTKESGKTNREQKDLGGTPVKFLEFYLQ